MLFLPELLPPLGVGPCDGAGELAAVVSCRSLGAVRLGVLVVCARRRVCVSRARSARRRRWLRQEILSLSSFPASVARAPVSPRSWRGPLYRSWPDLWFPSGDNGDGEDRRLVVSAQGWRQAGGGSEVAASPLWWVEADPGPKMYRRFPSADEPQRRRPRGPLQRFSTRRCAMMHLRLQGCWCSAPSVGGGFGDGSVKKQAFWRFSSEDLLDLVAVSFLWGFSVLLCLDCLFFWFLLGCSCVLYESLYCFLL